MNSTLKTFLTIIVTAAVVGGGVYFWQNLPKKEAEVMSSQQQEVVETRSTEQSPAPQQNKVARPEISDESEVEDERGLHSKMTMTNNGTEYTNFIYRFSVILPKTWGELAESKGDVPNGVKIHDSVRLTSKNDAQRYIQFQIVKTEDKNDPLVLDYQQTLLAGNSAYTFYYSGSQDYAGYGGVEETDEDIKIQAEISEIKKSFKLF